MVTLVVMRLLLMRWLLGLLRQRLNLRSILVSGVGASSETIMTNSSEMTNVGSSLQTVKTLLSGPMRPR